MSMTSCLSCASSATGGIVGNETEDSLGARGEERRASGGGWMAAGTVVRSWRDVCGAVARNDAGGIAVSSTGDDVGCGSYLVGDGVVALRETTAPCTLRMADNGTKSLGSRVRGGVLAFFVGVDGFSSGACRCTALDGGGIGCARGRGGRAVGAPRETGGLVSWVSGEMERGR